MPMYDYRCENCGKMFEELIWSSIIPDDEIQCPDCGEYKSKRQLSAPSVSSNSSSSHTHGRGCSSSGFS